MFLKKLRMKSNYIDYKLPSKYYSLWNVVFSFQVYVDIKPPHRCVRVIYKPGQVYVNPMVDGGDFMAQSGMLTYEVVQNFPKKDY